MKHMHFPKPWLIVKNQLIEPFIVFSASVIVSALLFMQILPVVFNLRESMFSDPDTILVTPTSNIWIAVLIVLPAFLMGFAALALWAMRHRNSLIGYFLPMPWRSVSLASAIVGAIFWVGMFSYCKVGTYGVYLRGASTLLEEHYYPWNKIREARLLCGSYETSDPLTESASVRYVLDLGNTSVDLLEENIRDNSDKIHIIHTILMDEMVPVIRNIAYLDDDSRVLIHRIETGHE